MPLQWIALAIAMTSNPAQARAPECFDAEVSARIVGQAPSVPPEFEDGSIVMIWPWFVDLDIRQVRNGTVPSGRITVLSLQHTYWRRDLGVRRWLLRRNTLGTYNLVELAKHSTVKRCIDGAPPAKAYITPDEGETLDVLRQAGERRYGVRP